MKEFNRWREFILSSFGYFPCWEELWVECGESGRRGDMVEGCEEGCRNGDSSVARR